MSRPHALAARALAAALVLWLPLAAHAAWVSEGLEVGLHESATLDAPVVALIESGTEVEVTERDGELARVRAPNGEEGWLDARYLADDPPASARLAAQEEAVRVAQARTEEALEREREATEKHREAIERTESLAERVLELEREVETARAAVDEARAARSAIEEERDSVRAALEVASAERNEANRERSRLQAEFDSADSAPAQNAALSHALRDVQHLAEENQDLKQELAVLEANQAMVAATPDAEPEPERKPEADSAGAQALPAIPATRATPAPPSLLGFLEWRPWQWLLLISGLLLAFGAGGYVIDLGVRRRHGGFRI